MYKDDAFSLSFCQGAPHQRVSTSLQAREALFANVGMNRGADFSLARTGVGSTGGNRGTRDTPLRTLRS